MTPPVLDERFADWVDDRLAPHQQQHIKAMLRDDPALRSAAEGYRRVVELTRAALAEDTHPPTELVDRVLAGADSDNRPTGALAMWGGLAAAAGITLWVAVAGGFGASNDPASADLARAPAANELEATALPPAAAATPPPESPTPPGPTTPRKSAAEDFKEETLGAGVANTDRRHGQAKTQAQTRGLRGVEKAKAHQDLVAEINHPVERRGGTQGPGSRTRSGGWGSARPVPAEGHLVLVVDVPPAAPRPPDSAEQEADKSGEQQRRRLAAGSLKTSQAADPGTDIAAPLSSVELLGPTEQRLRLEVTRATHLGAWLKEATRANVAGKTVQQLYIPLPTDQVFTVTGSATELPIYFERLEGFLAGRGQNFQVQWAPPQESLDRALTPRFAATTPTTAGDETSPQRETTGATAPAGPARPQHSILLVLRPRADGSTNQPAKPTANKKQR